MAAMDQRRTDYSTNDAPGVDVPPQEGELMADKVVYYYFQSAIQLGRRISDRVMMSMSLITDSSHSSATVSSTSSSIGRDEYAATDDDDEVATRPQFNSHASLTSSTAAASSTISSFPNIPRRSNIFPSQMWSPIVFYVEDPWILVQIPILMILVVMVCHFYYSRRTRQQLHDDTTATKHQNSHNSTTTNNNTTNNKEQQQQQPSRRSGLATMDRRSSRHFSSPDRLSRINPVTSSVIPIAMDNTRNIGRSRSSTFDFFGMNDGIGEEEPNNSSRSNSLRRLSMGGGSVSGGNGAGGSSGGNGPSRKRTGSMDLLLQSLGVGGGTNKHSKNGFSSSMRGSSGGGGDYYNFFHRDDSDEMNGVLYDEFGIVTFSSQLAYHGPSNSAISYSTWTPPTTISRRRSYKEGGGMAPPTPASKNNGGRLLASDIILKLRRKVVLDINKSSLSIVVSNNPTGASGQQSQPPTGQFSYSKKFDFTLPVPRFSTHVVPPAMGGVLNVYVLGSPKEEWMEFTFDSAHQAAQFQLDLSAYQVLGSTLRNMYQVLSLVHQGSVAHDGQEFVLHDKQQPRDDNDNKDKTRSSETKTATENGETNGGAAEGGEEAATTATDKETTNSKKNNKPTFIDAGVAWDDAMRALSSIPSIRIALERLWLHHRNHGFPATTSPTTTTTTTDAGNSGSKKNKGKNTKTASGTLDTSSPSNSSDSHQASLTEEYVNKRLLLGPVDFFRLFVPTLPETAVPKTDESNKDRMEQLLRWRKRVARGAVLVRSYTLSHKVVNEGWSLPLPVTFQMPTHLQPFRKRLAYDDNEDNNRRDFTAQNEYYEATVSRDVLCHVRPDDYFFQQEVLKEEDEKRSLWNSFFSKRPTLVVSPCQAYSLVAAHIFQLPDLKADGENRMNSHPLNASRDPVAVIPSLFDLISKHPEVDFFVSTFYPKARNIAVVVCYVRSLPKGIDPSFDNAMNRFTNGTKEVRDQKLHMMVQLGPYVGLSFIGWAVLRVLSFLLSLTRKGRESPMGYETTRDRSPFPALRLMNYAKTHHFGGALQTDPSMPQNYVAVNASYDSMYMPNTIARLLFMKLENGALKENIMDFSFVLEGEEAIELPERALSTIRMVHVESDDVALPVSASANWKPRSNDLSEPPSDDIMRGDLPHRVSMIVSEKFHNMVAVMGSPLRPSARLQRPLESALPDLPELSSSEEIEEVDYNDISYHVESEDSMEIAANLITDILADISIPIRKEQLRRERRGSGLSLDSSFDDNASGASSSHQVRGPDDTTPVSVLSRITREDMKRFFVASNFDAKIAAVRLVETAAWRGITFPIDKRRCRVELQNGQFFQQGRDLSGNPVFYFRNMCLGPWRGNVDAAISAVLHRLNKSLEGFTKTNPGIQFVLIILMGRPYGKPIISNKEEKKEFLEVVMQDGRKDRQKERVGGGGGEKVVVPNGQDGAASQEETTLGDMTLGVGHHEAWPSSANWISNPRIDPNESWQVHTNKELIVRLVTILLRHYPERLSQGLVIAGKGNNSYYNGSAVAGRIALGTVLDSKETKKKIKFLKRSADLLRYVSEKELVSIVGGKASIRPSVFDSQ